MSIITIKNKLEILSGGFIRIPGVEPLSAFSSNTLSKNMKCNNSYLHYKRVLTLIPGSKIVKVMCPSGMPGTGYFIELPSGPPKNGNECPEKCLIDYYQLLRDVANTEGIDENTILNKCSADRNWSGCMNKLRDFNQTAIDPEMRPNQKPLSNMY